MREMSCPPKNNWKLRWRKARRVVGNQPAAETGPESCGFPMVGPEMVESVTLSSSSLSDQVRFDYALSWLLSQVGIWSRGTNSRFRAAGSWSKVFDARPQITLEHPDTFRNHVGVV